MTTLNAPAQDWVLSLVDNPGKLRERWAVEPSAGALAPLGRVVDIVEVAEGLGWDALGLLRRQRRRIGPVVWDGRAEVVMFLLPAGSHAQTTTALAARGLGGGALPYRYLSAGCRRALPGACDSGDPALRWLEPPVGAPQPLTKGADLAAALGEVVALADAIEASWCAGGPHAAAS